MKLTSILKEIRVRSGRTLFPQDLKDIDIVFEDFGTSNSGFELYEPLTEYKDKYRFGHDIAIGTFELYDDEENYPEYQAFKRLVEKPKGVYVGTDSYINICPGAPTNSFYMRLEVHPENNMRNGPFIKLSIPYYDASGRYSVGWFDQAGGYHADTTHFDNDGNYIG
jgi:hypothetical protein